MTRRSNSVTKKHSIVLTLKKCISFTFYTVVLSWTISVKIFISYIVKALAQTSDIGYISRLTQILVFLKIAIKTLVLELIDESITWLQQ